MAVLSRHARGCHRFGGKHRVELVVWQQTPLADDLADGLPCLY
jgi:hypothetical protein